MFASSCGQLPQSIHHDSVGEIGAIFARRELGGLLPQRSAREETGRASLGSNSNLDEGMIEPDPDAEQDPEHQGHGVEFPTVPQHLRPIVLKSAVGRKFGLQDVHRDTSQLACRLNNKPGFFGCKRRLFGLGCVRIRREVDGLATGVTSLTTRGLGARVTKLARDILAKRYTGALPTRSPCAKYVPR